MADLMKNQDSMHKLRDELECEIGTDIVKESHLAHLPHLQACVKETLRLHPPGPLLLPHRALQINIPSDGLHNSQRLSSFC